VIKIRELLKDGYVLFILFISMIVNACVFFQEYVEPASAEHWQVGLAFIGLSLLTYTWNKFDKSEIKEYTGLVLLVNGILAIVLDLVATLIG